MKALVDAELLKLRSTRMQAALVLATLVLEVMTVVVSVPKAGDADAPVSLDAPELLARVVGESFGVPEVLILLFGVLAITQEFRYGTATSTFLVSPRRGRVLLAKWLSVALASVPLTVLSLAVAFAVGVPLINSRGGNVTVGAELWQVVAASFAVMALLGVLGVAFGALVRNQIVAVVAVLVWMLAVEQIVTTSYPAVGKWLPIGATFGFLQLGSALTTKGNMLSGPAAGSLLALYGVVACVAAYVVTPKRDIL